MAIFTVSHLRHFESDASPDSGSLVMAPYNTSPGQSSTGITMTQNMAILYSISMVLYSTILIITISILAFVLLSLYECV